MALLREDEMTWIEGWRSAWRTFATAMSPPPRRATTTELMVSGRLVPAASTVRPMTMSGTLATQPTWLAHATMYHAMTPIHTMDMAKASQMPRQLLHLGVRQSGTVYPMARIQGNLITWLIFCRTDACGDWQKVRILNSVRTESEHGWVATRRNDGRKRTGSEEPSEEGCQGCRGLLRAQQMHSWGGRLLATRGAHPLGRRDGSRSSSSRRPPPPAPTGPQGSSARAPSPRPRETETPPEKAQMARERTGGVLATGRSRMRS